MSDPHLVLPALVLWGFPWIGSVGVLIYLAGLQGIGTEIYEAANLDGAGSWSRFRFIEFPLLMTQIRISFVLLIIGTLQGFGLQLLLLGPDGGAGGRGMVPGLWMYRTGFIEGEFGYACAIGLTLFVFILLLTYLNNRYLRVKNDFGSPAPNRPRLAQARHHRRRDARGTAAALHDVADFLQG